MLRLDRHTLPFLIGFLGLLALLTATLSITGQPWWCHCGAWHTSSWDIWSEHNSQHLLDPYSFSHFLHGIFFYALLHRIPANQPVRLLAATAIEVSWEILENSPIVMDRYRSVTIALGYSGDSILNSNADVVVCALGYLFASRVPTKISVFTVIAVEVLSAILIRDGLFLNILMLIYPLDGVREWQMGT